MGKLWVSLGLTVCLLREDLVPLPTAGSVQGLPRLRAESRMGWEPFDPEPLPPGWRVPPSWSMCGVLPSLWGC